MIAKYDIDPDGFYFDDTLDATATAVALLPAEVNGKKLNILPSVFFTSTSQGPYREQYINVQMVSPLSLLLHRSPKPEIGTNLIPHLDMSPE